MRLSAIVFFLYSNKRWYESAVLSYMVRPDSSLKYLLARKVNAVGCCDGGVGTDDGGATDVRAVQLQRQLPWKLVLVSYYPLHDARVDGVAGCGHQLALLHTDDMICLYIHIVHHTKLH